jgi:hypothetical protein
MNETDRCPTLTFYCLKRIKIKDKTAQSQTGRGGLVDRIYRRKIQINYIQTIFPSNNNSHNFVNNANDGLKIRFSTRHSH